MVNHAQDFVAVKKYEILQYSLIPTDNVWFRSNMHYFQQHPSLLHDHEHVNPKMQDDMTV